MILFYILKISLVQRNKKNINLIKQLKKVNGQKNSKIKTDKIARKKLSLSGDARSSTKTIFQPTNGLCYVRGPCA